MSAIFQTTSLWGENSLSTSHTPQIRRYCNVIYIPEHCQGSGLYDAAGYIIDSTVDGQRFSKPYKSEQRQKQEVRPIKTLTGGDFLYIGSLNPHYGHFIVNSLSRLWPLQVDKSFKKMTLVCHAPANRDAWEKIHFATMMVRGLGIDWDDILFISEPTLIHQVFVPDQSIIEQTLVYPVFGETGKLIGKQHWGHINSRKEPLYISKTRLKSGVGHIQDENVIEEKASRAGFRVIYPETLTFSEQIKALSEHQIIAGTLGSGFHTSLFAPSNKTLICLAPVKDINTNYKLIDSVTQANSLYYVPKNLSYAYGKDFQTTCVAENIEQVADEFIESVMEQTAAREI
ncbi:glycosyltransferase family 61 protein [Agrobacterium rubi]|uniref:glycosyltransferase family 61 protein n=1 Tax=Agrobacterium rubi TaxID=28099 RepID=UPI001571A3D5|nr:glycosyltransferase family 61 protein [Agrobacterium rubi]NTF11099.1 glycosyltransferase family 61 protein [Agrobacterium rubi]NTF23473.1 glycosyltransferase family 61 protein [Agrobacterium rubi]NTF30414.1 glycosyltransferase family 61 protein [Agrobacterium rubi]